MRSKSHNSHSEWHCHSLHLKKKSECSNQAHKPDQLAQPGKSSGIKVANYYIPHNIHFTCLQLLLLLLLLYNYCKTPNKHPWDIFPFQQLFTEWNSDYFQLRYSQKREKTPQHRVLGVGEGRLLEGGVYWGFYGIRNYPEENCRKFYSHFPQMSQVDGQ